VLLRQFVDGDLGCASYLVGDEESGEAVLVDPTFAVEALLAAAVEADLRLTRVLETHTHADHLSGHGRLALEHGLPVSIHEGARAAYPHDALADGTEVAVGSLTIRTIHTPGHRPEHCCFLAGNTLLTGDSLFIGTVARPDLAVEPREGAEGLFHSVHALLELRDDVRVLPGHVAGSLCGTKMSEERSSSIGFERRFNRALALATVEEFVADSMAALSIPRPPNMERIVELNRGGWIGLPPPLAPVTSVDGALVVDVRPAEDFAAGHVSGALNVPLAGGSVGTKAGFLIRPGERVVLQASSPEEAESAAARLYAVGILDLAGYLVDPLLAESSEPIDLEELARLLADDEVELIDVREQGEREAGYIPGSRHIPYRLLRATAGDLPTDRPIVTICSTGARAAVAASIVGASGREARPVLHAGVPDWEARGRRTIEFRHCSP
jgi:glyoxylase-like metal-dependent hydrolase (beta-lactamase superfamily II)/rhodanese-related sulfurtransferase